MLQLTFERLNKKFPLKNIFVCANKEYAQEILSEIPKLPKKNLILEPASRERVSAIALFMARLKNFSEPIIILPSDHLIKKNSEFLKAIIAGEKFIKKNPDYILAFGAKPIFPKVAFFKEKPNLKRAKKYLETKKYFWNMGIYIFFPALMEKLIKDFVPDNYKRYKKLKTAFGKPQWKKVLETEFPKMDNVSFDYSITENWKNVAFIPTDIGWSDIGSWSVLKDCLSDDGKNFIKGNYTGINSKNIMVYGTNNRLVATVGVENLVIAHTDDIILICQKEKSQDVKKIIKKLEKDKKFDYI
jgi:mannose-1-phosphate guanylyltransferase